MSLWFVFVCVYCVLWCVGVLLFGLVSVRSVLFRCVSVYYVSWFSLWYVCVCWHGYCMVLLVCVVMVVVACVMLLSVVGVLLFVFSGVVWLVCVVRRLCCVLLFM